MIAAAGASDLEDAFFKLTERARTGDASRRRRGAAMIGTWWAVVRKELVDGLRDRRTILTMLFTGIALGPIALLLMANYVSGLEEKSEAKKVMVEGIERAPATRQLLRAQRHHAGRGTIGLHGPHHERRIAGSGDRRARRLRRALRARPDDRRASGVRRLTQWFAAVDPARGGRAARLLARDRHRPGDRAGAGPATAGACQRRARQHRHAEAAGGLPAVHHPDVRAAGLG